MPWRDHSIYGITLRTNFPLAAPLPPGEGTPDLTFTCVTEPPPEANRAVPRALIHSAHLLPSGEPLASLYRAEEFDLIHFAEAVDYYLFPDRIVGRLLDPGFHPIVEVYLLGNVLAYWCEMSGTPVLHASAVVVDGNAVAFTASTRGGKSSLAAGLMQCGCPLLTEDLLRIRFHADGFRVEPGYPQMRFWPHDAERLLGRSDELDPAHPSSPKRRVPVGPGGFGTFCGESRPLGCLYLPSRGEPGSDERAIEIARVPPRRAIVELIRGMFAPRLVKAAGWEQLRFELFADLASRIPVRTVRYPYGFEHFPAVLEAILDDVRHTASSHDSSTDKS